MCLKQAPRDTAARVFRVLFWGEKKEKSIIGTFFRPGSWERDFEGDVQKRRKQVVSCLLMYGTTVERVVELQTCSELIGKTAKFSQTHSTD